MTDHTISQQLEKTLKEQQTLRISKILSHSGISPGVYYRATKKKEEKASKRKQKKKHWKLISPEKEEMIIRTALEHPVLGYKKITHILRTRKGQKISKKAVYRVLKANNLLKSLRKRQRESRKRYEQKLKELLPTGINQVWQMDVTYVYVDKYGWHFQIDVQDYYSKYVLAQRFTRSYSGKEGTLALKEAITEAERLCGPLEGKIYLITDNGTTFVSGYFAKELKKQIIEGRDIEIFEHVRIGYRMPEHIGSIERYHGNCKQECIYLNWFTNPIEAEVALKNYRIYYNYERPHWGVNLKTPAEVYLGKDYFETLEYKPKEVDQYLKSA